MAFVAEYDIYNIVCLVVKAGALIICSWATHALLEVGTNSLWL